MPTAFRGGAGGTGRLTRLNAANDRRDARTGRKLTRSYVIKVTGDVEQCFGGSGLKYRSVRLYPAKAIVAGVMTANVGDVYFGETRQALTELREGGDASAYAIYGDTPNGDLFEMSDLFIKGTAGDGVVAIFQV